MPLNRDSVWFTGLLGALATLPPLSIDMGLPGIPSIEATFPDAVGRGALTLSLFLAGFAVAPLGAGPLADRYGRRATLLAALALYVPSAALCTFAPSFPLLLASRLLQGVAAGTCVILPLAITRDLFVGNAARHRMSQITAVLGLGPMVAPILGGLVMRVADWRTIYALQALCGLALLVLFALAFTESLPPARRRSLHPRHLIESYRMVLADRTFCGFALFYAFGFACLFAFVAGSPAVFMGGLGLSSQLFSVLFAVTACGQLFGSLVSARLTRRRVSSRAILTGGLVATALGALAAFALVAAGIIHTYTLAPFIAVVIFCFGMTAPSANHEALAGLPHVAGAAAGLMRCTQMLLAAAASATLALLEPWGHPALAMTTIMAGTILLAALIFVGLLRREGARPQSVFRLQSGSL